MKQKIYRLALEEKQNILHRISGILERIKEVQFAYAYGSFGEGLPFHDIDIGIYLGKIEQSRSLIHSVELGGVLESELRLPVDVRVLNFAPVSFFYHVIRGESIFSRNEDLRAEIAEQTIRRYLDIKPIIKRGIKEAFAA